MWWVEWEEIEGWVEVEEEEEGEEDIFGLRWVGGGLYSVGWVVKFLGVKIFWFKIFWVLNLYLF